MATIHDRRTRLVLVLVGLAVLSLLLLAQVVWTVFFAITLVYVLYPLRERLVERGVPVRVTSALLTALAFASVLVLFAPIVAVVYQRRDVILEFLRNLPPALEFTFAGFTYVVEASALIPVVQNTLSAVAVSLARLAPILAMKLLLFGFLVYAALYRPETPRRLLFEVVDEPVRAELVAYHRRIRGTLYGIYVVQAATGVLTFLLALPVFASLGYEAYFSLAVAAGIFQFVPVIGPSVVVVALAAIDLVVGNVVRAALVLTLGLVVVGLLPDAVLRPRLAHHTAGMSASLYFVGFLGGVLTVGPVGIIAGPLVLALLVETLELLANGLGSAAAESDGPDDRATGADSPDVGAGNGPPDDVEAGDRTEPEGTTTPPDDERSRPTTDDAGGRAHTTSERPTGSGEQERR